MAEAGEIPRAVVRVALKLGDDVLTVQIAVPTAPIRAVELLPILMALDNAVVDVYAREAEKEGRAISCKKGCGACCRQLVPISEVEAQYLGELVAQMPPERRERVESRFHAARERLEELGMRERLLRAAGPAGPEEQRQLTLDYFACGVPCPFLEEESCGIHFDRPLVCREYNVTSPAAWCADPSRHDIHRVAIPIHLSSLLSRFADGEGKRPYRRLPLVLALNWTSHDSEPMPRLPGPQMLQNFLRLLTHPGDSAGEHPG
jgi:Fe-S-cluster containining protein